jgi:hypothetical protein
MGLLTGRTKAQDTGREADADVDPAQPDSSNSFVGRPAGDDADFANETGAERRSEHR